MNRNFFGRMVDKVVEGRMKQAKRYIRQMGYEIRDEKEFKSRP